MSDCPFNFANGWHNQRDEMLLRVEITTTLRAQINERRKTMSADDLLSL